MNLCTVCGEDFSSVKLFDRHRQGTFEPLDRYCLMPGEMAAKGWVLDKHGRWIDPAEVARTRADFSGARTAVELSDDS